MCCIAFPIVFLEASLLPTVDLLRVFLFVVELRPYLLLLFFLAVIDRSVAIILRLVRFDPFLSGPTSN